MRRQTSFSDIEYASQKVITRKERFLSRMDELVPWDEWCALIEPFWNAECERTGDKSLVPTETMLRLYLLQRWYSLSDEAAEEVVLGRR